MILLLMRLLERTTEKGLKKHDMAQRLGALVKSRHGRQGEMIIMSKTICQSGTGFPVLQQYDLLLIQHRQKQEVDWEIEILKTFENHSCSVKRSMQPLNEKRTVTKTKIVSATTVVI